ncbi:MAG: DNA repair protein RadC [Lachnospiraceae bacterium]|nr:DNA repair protein RadC [Lachnospiraceae bacterium]
MSNLKEVYAPEELPYDKFLRLGAENLSDAELLAIMLRTGTKDKTPIELGRDILKLAGERFGLLGLHHFDVKELTQIPGIGEVKAVQLLCIAEIAKRTANMSAKTKLCFDKPETVASYYMEQLRHKTTEHLTLVLLDNRKNILNETVISVGTSNATLVSPREIGIRALRFEAAYMMLLHNHPSGDPTPSRQDILVTRKIKEVSDLVEIPLLDHIIIGDNRYTSFNQKGLL